MLCNYNLLIKWVSTKRSFAVQLKLIPKNYWSREKFPKTLKTFFGTKSLFPQAREYRIIVCIKIDVLTSFIRNPFVCYKFLQYLQPMDLFIKQGNIDIVRYWHQHRLLIPYNYNLHLYRLEVIVYPTLQQKKQSHSTEEKCLKETKLFHKFCCVASPRETSEMWRAPAKQLFLVTNFV